MKLLMTTTLGLRDAKRLEVSDAREGETVEADPPAADELLRRGWAVPFAAPAPQLKAAPAKPEKPGKPFDA